MKAVVYTKYGPSALLEGGKAEPVINRVYPLNDTAEAHRYVEKDTPEERR